MSPALGLGIAMGAIGFVAGLLWIGMALLGYYRYRCGSLNKAQISYLIAYSIAPLVLILPPIVFQTLYASDEQTTMIGFGVMVGVLAGFTFGGALFGLSIVRLLQPPAEKRWDIKIKEIQRGP